MTLVTLFDFLYNSIKYQMYFDVFQPRNNVNCLEDGKESGSSREYTKQSQ